MNTQGDLNAMLERFPSSCREACQKDAVVGRVRALFGVLLFVSPFPAARLVLEVDGLHHDDDNQWAYDMRRQAWLEAERY